MTPLRQRLIEDLRIRNYSAHTVEIYIRHVALFAKHFGCSPERLGAEEVRRYQLYLRERNVSWSLYNQAVSSLRFFYTVTLRRSLGVERLPYAKRPKRLPCVLSAQEVVQFLMAVKGDTCSTSAATTFCTLPVGGERRLRFHRPLCVRWRRCRH